MGNARHLETGVFLFRIMLKLKQVIKMFILTINTVKESVAIFQWINLIIPALISLIGIVINYLVTKGTVKREINKYQKTIIIDKSSEIMSKAFNLFNIKTSEMTTEKYIELQKEIYCYSSKKATELFSIVMEESYKLPDTDTRRMFAALTLFMAQMKFDISGEIISPDTILKIRIKDYDSNIEFKRDINSKINQLILELNLNKKFKID